MDIDIITSNIIHAAFEVWRTLGTGFLEAVYKNSLAQELREADLLVATEKEIKVFYKNKAVGLYYADLLVENSVIVEIKCVKNIAPCHFKQVKNYLKATGAKTGLIINFQGTKIGIKRVYGF